MNSSLCWPDHPTYFSLELWPGPGLIIISLKTKTKKTKIGPKIRMGIWTRAQIIKYMYATDPTNHLIWPLKYFLRTLALKHMLDGHVLKFGSGPVLIVTNHIIVSSPVELSVETCTSMFDKSCVVSLMAAHDRPSKTFMSITLDEFKA